MPTFEPRFQLSAGLDASGRRLARIEQAISDQRNFLHRVPDPDTRERAEVHLYKLMSMREHLARGLNAA